MGKLLIFEYSPIARTTPFGYRPLVPLPGVEPFYEVDAESIDSRGGSLFLIL
ncbi:hypothetical protein CCACVL1_00746, partial [Corchorus capsularis]